MCTVQCTYYSEFHSCNHFSKKELKGRFMLQRHVSTGVLRNVPNDTNAFRIKWNVRQHLWCKPCSQWLLPVWPYGTVVTTYSSWKMARFCVKFDLADSLHLSPLEVSWRRAVASMCCFGVDADMLNIVSVHLFQLMANKLITYHFPHHKCPFFFHFERYFCLQSQRSVSDGAITLSYMLLVVEKSLMCEGGKQIK